MGMRMVGRMLEKRREKLGLGVAACSKRLGVSRWTYRRWTDGDERRGGASAEPGLATLQKIAAFLEVPLEDVVAKVSARDRPPRKAATAAAP